MKRLTEQLIAFAAGNRTKVFAALLLLGLLAGLSLFRIKFTNDVSQLFPDSRDAGTTFRVLNETRLGNTVQLEFIVSDAIEKHEKYLDAVSKKLDRLPEVKNVVFRYRAHDLFQELTALTALIPRFYSPEVLDRCEAEPAVKKALKQLAFPIPGGVRMLRNQPFGLEQNILTDLRKLDDLTGMRLASGLPYFATPDKHRAMIVFNADLQIGDADSVRKLIGKLHRILEPLPAGMQFRILSGAMHTLGNEEVLKRDAMLSCTVSLALFLLIFLIFYRRDWRTLWIPAIPLYASLFSLGIMTLFFREICLYVVGLGSCITGLAIDQGIHVYAAYHGPDAERRTAALTEPMMLSAATSILVFVFLALTGIRAYVQLAAFAGLSLASSCMIALIVLPLFLNREKQMAELKLAFPTWKISPVLPLLLFPAAVFCGMLLLKNANFTLESLDGTPREIRMQEQDFNAAWRTPGIRTALLAAFGKTPDEAQTRLLKITNERLQCNLFNIALPPVPPASRQKQNLEKWRTPEIAKKIDRLEKQIRETGKKHGLPENFFSPFFNQLRKSIGSDDLTLPPMLESIVRKMVWEHNGTASAIALVRDDETSARFIRPILRKHGDGHCALLSKEGFKQMIREDLGGRFLWILPLSVLSALALAYGVFRRFSDVLLAMIPVYVSFCGLFILGALTGFRATPAGAFALILLTGLAIDYGIYAVSQLRNPNEISIRESIFLSAATTVAGAGALVLSKHPALFGTGIVLSVGITLACLSGLYLVPMLKRNGKPGRLLSAVLFLFLLTGCTSGIPLEEYSEAQSLKEKMRIYPETPFQIQANAILEVQDRKFTFLLAAELNPATGTIKAAGVSGAGTLLFRINGRDCIWGSGIPENAQKLLASFREDLCRIFLLKDRNPLAVKQKAEYIVLSSQNGVKWEIHPDRTIRKETSFPIRKWTGEYRDSGRTVLYCNHRGNYTIRLRIIQLTEKSKND